MADSIRSLYERFREHRSEEDWKIAYTHAYYDEKGKDDSLHHHRRRVSSFYQFMAYLAHGGIVDLDAIYGLWGKSNLRIIDQLLRPIECDLMPILLKHETLIGALEALASPPPRQNMSGTFRMMLDLYENAPEEAPGTRD
jgi:hypothetical protein